MNYLLGLFNVAVWCLSFALACYGLYLAVNGGILAGAIVYGAALVVRLFRMAPPD